MTVVPTFPSSLQKHQGISWGFAGGTQNGGSSLAGGPPNVYSLLGGQYWMCEMSALVINELRRAHYHMWEGIIDQGVQAVIVCMREFDTDQPWVVDSDRINSRNAIGTPFSDGAEFSSGIGFSSRFIDIRPTADFALRQTTMTFNLVGARSGGLVGGEHFTIDHPTWGPRLYRIVRAYGVASNGHQQVSIRPPLREAAPMTTTLLDFDDPRCVMRLNGKDGMRAKFDITRNARPDLSFVEYGSKVG